LAHFCSMCGPHFCAMKITEDVRKYAADKGLDDTAAVGEGLKEMSETFVKAGAEVYVGDDGSHDKRSLT
ncbi:MAG TPA: hypothetical protein PKY05_17080, partial [Fibrobacteria bacterium]|nr:hypothetical protein [Fibrobacteria bacterium]